MLHTLFFWVTPDAKARKHHVCCTEEKEFTSFCLSHSKYVLGCGCGAACDDFLKWPGTKGSHHQTLRPVALKDAAMTNFHCLLHVFSGTFAAQQTTRPTHTQTHAAVLSLKHFENPCPTSPVSDLQGWRGPYKDKRIKLLSLVELSQLKSAGAGVSLIGFVKLLHFIFNSWLLVQASCWEFSCCRWALIRTKRRSAPDWFHRLLLAHH